MKINYKGRTLETIDFDGTFEPEKLQFVRDNYYQTTKEDALQQLKKVLLEGKVMTTKIYRYYFEYLANNCLKDGCKWSINEVLESDELLQSYINKTYKNEKVFNGKTLDSNIRTAFRIGGTHTLGRMTNFPLKDCLSLLKEYLPEGATRYLDPSCGWGTRMIASAVLDLEYIGFDVNSELIEKLEELGKDIQQIKPNFKFKIYKQGSQYYVPELENSADIILTSPPYYNLENYINNEYEQEPSLNGSYDNWVETFVNPMMSNMARYIKPNGYVLMNVKDFKKYTLVTDFKQATTQLEFMGFESLKINQRFNHKKFLVDNSEPVLLFKKKGDK